jgi:hypothetical protein
MRLYLLTWFWASMHRTYQAKMQMKTKARLKALVPIFMLQC